MKKKKFLTRLVFAIIMLSMFYGIIMAGHLYASLLVMFIALRVSFELL